MQQPDLPFRWRTFTAALIVLSVGFAVAWIVNPPVYSTNDDVSLRQALEGETAPGEPATGFTLMTHAALGWPVAYLYRMAPVVPWWDLIVAGTLIWSLGVLVALVWDGVGNDWLARTLTVSLLLVAVAPLAVALQYTIGATLAGAAALLLAVLELHSRRPVRRSVLLLAMVTLLGGLVVRTLGAVAGVVAAGVFLIPLMVGGALETRRVAMVVVASAVLAAAVQYADGLLYALQPEWGRYYQYQWMIVRLFEWRGEPSDQALDAIRAAAGWTRNDWRMVSGYFSVDPALHGYESVARVYEASTRLFGWQGWLSWAAERVRQTDWRTVSTMVERSAAPLVAMAGVAIAYPRWRGIAAIAGLGLLYLAFCVGVETAFKELPSRLLAPFQAAVVAVALITASRFRREGSAARVVVGVAVVLSVLGPHLRENWTTAASMSADARALDGEVREILRLSPSLVVLHADTFRREYWWRPFHRPSIRLPAIALAWNNQNPLLQRFLQRSGRKGLLESMCSDPSVLVIADEGRLDFVTTFFAEHRHEQIVWTPVYTGSFPAWRCSMVRS